MHYFPPYEVLSRSFLRDGAGSNGDNSVTMTKDVFLALLKAALSGVEIDCNLYAEQNPDLKEAYDVDEAKLRQHFVSIGYIEGRAFPFKVFDESYYLKRNPDLALALAKGKLSNALNHYQSVGMGEFRVANATTESDVAFWRNLLSKPITRGTRR